jgi:Uma2 family endonuclease
MAATLPLALDIANLERVVLRPGPEFTEDDFFEFCQEHSLLRIERNSEGEVIIMAPAGFDSDLIGVEVLAQLREWAKKDGRGVVAGPTAGLTLPDTSVLSPDACWIPIGRLKAVPRKQRQKFPALVPAFVVEIRSPSDRKKDLHEKMQAYLRNKVELAWLIDPQSNTVTVYSAHRETPNEPREPERVSGEGPVVGFVLELKQIYDQL